MGLSSQENADAKRLLDRIAAMLTRLGQRVYSAQEEPVGYGQRRTIPIPIAIPTPIGTAKRKKPECQQSGARDGIPTARDPSR